MQACCDCRTIEDGDDCIGYVLDEDGDKCLCHVMYDMDQALQEFAADDE